MLAIDDKDKLINYTKGNKLIREFEKLYARDEGIEKGKIETCKLTKIKKWCILTS